MNVSYYVQCTRDALEIVVDTQLRDMQPRNRKGAWDYQAESEGGSYSELLMRYSQ